MSLASGTKFGPYEILAPLGEGGMGEVYRAKDTRLGREVALKILSARFATNTTAHERFERESRAVAALSHPNILALYDVGLEGETAYAVTELLEGQTLRKALQPGSLPIRKALDVATQVGRGLVAAHEKGIVHRDLKPENLFLTRSGHVKILDFGIAKLTLAESDDSDSGPISNGGYTEPGKVVGTVGYMSPEQARGQPASARSDIFSLGVVLYEMLSGKRAFQRESGIDTLSAILKEEPPDLMLTNQLVPPGLERLVRHCLEKDPALRFQTARDLVFDLEALGSDSLSGSHAPAVPLGRASFWKPSRVLAAAVLAAVLGAGAAWVLATRVPGRARGGSPRLTFQRLTSQPGGETKPALSPDGETVAFVSTAAGNRDIWIQRVGSDKATNLTADSSADEMDPAFSPDGSLIAFHSDRDGGGLFVMGAAGESVRRVTAGGFSPDWTPDGKEIVYADEEITSPLLRSRSKLWAANVASGQKRPLLATDGVEPAVSPHGLRVAYWGLKGDTAQRDVYTIPLAGLKEGETAVPVTNDAAVDFSPFWSPDGKTLYFGSDRGGSFNLWRVPIDEDTGRPRAEPEPVTLPTTWAGIFPGSFRGARSRSRIAFTAPAELMTIERVTLGPALEPAGPPAVLRRGSAMFLDLEISPDGSTLATRTQGASENLCVLAADGSSLRQLTRDAFRNRWARWSPDGQRIFFYSNRSGSYGVWTIKPDGGDMTRVSALPETSWAAPVPSPDGSLIALGRPSTGHVVVVPLAPATAASGTAPAPPLEIEGKWAWDWSPDGRQLLVSRRGAVSASGVLLCGVPSGRCEVLAPNAEQGRFFPDGRHVGYVERGEIHVVDLATRVSRRLLPPRVDSPVTRFCVSRDGRTLYCLRDVSEGDIWVATFPVTLAAGTKLGSYEILAAIGAGGMGEVYRARDVRVDRAVALKVLPEEFFESEERRGRFEREARMLASLNHPGIAVLYSFEENGGRHVLTMELVEGDDLAVRLASGPLSLEESLSLARQIAEALEAAHEKGIVHRDLKPANIKVTPDGRVKLLDFGLAKIFEGDAAGGSSSGATQSPTLTARGTAAGMILGTAAYMSPEQARGKPVDKRTDVWAFGCVLYEMLTGKRTFEGETVSDTLAAILTKDPDWAALPEQTPGKIRDLLRRCLRREAKQRLHDIADARLELEETAAAPSPTAGRSGTAGAAFIPWALAAALAVAAGALALRARAPQAGPALTWHRLTFENGTVLSAGFGSGGKIVYSAAWGGSPPAVFSTGVDFSESKVLVPAPSKLLSVSKSGEMAVLLRARSNGSFDMEGTLARVPADGGAPRELLEKVLDAAWSPDGSQLAIVRRAGGKVQLEFPPGRVLYESFGGITSPRFSPKGDRIAFADRPAKKGNWGTVSVVDLEGRRTVWSPIHEVIEGIVWAPSGQEVWFGAEGARNAVQLFAVGADRKPRLLTEAPGDLAPLAVDAGGRLLANRHSLRTQIVCALRGDSRPRDLASVGSSLLGDLSPDGTKILLTYRGPGAQTTEGDVVLRPTDSDSFVRLGRGLAESLSPDGRWAAAVLWGNDAFAKIWANGRVNGAPPRTDAPPAPVDSIVLMPTGAGEARTLAMGGLAIIRAIGFHPDHRRLVLSGSTLGEDERLWAREIEGDAPLRSISPPGLYALTSAFLSPDGRWAAVVDGEDALWLVPVDGGEPKRMPGVEQGEMFAGWAGDGRSFYVFRYPGRIVIHRVEFPTGARRLWKEATLPDAASAQEPYHVIVARDADAWAAGYQSLLGELYVVEGLK